MIHYTPTLKHRLLKKPHRSASIPGIESKAALQLLTVASYLQWLEAAAHTIGNNILKSFNCTGLRHHSSELQQKCEDLKGAE